MWSAGIGAASFSPTPGGIGVVEVIMTAALVVAGVHSPEAVAAVLRYRLVNSKSNITTTWLARNAVRERRETATS